MRLGDLTSPEVPAGLVLVVPLGACEQHGPHLPLDTDTRIAVALADRLAATLEGIAVAPPIAVGSSGEHAGFPGTLSIGQAALELVVVELVRSADAFAGVVLVNGHGGNREPVERAEATARHDGRRLLAWWPASRDLHAGRTETSALLHLDPGCVRLERAEAGDTRGLDEVLPDLRAGGVVAVSTNGVLGDPTAASAVEGERIVADWVASLVAAVEAWR